MDNDKLKNDLANSFDNAKTAGDLRAAIYDVVMATILGKISDEEAASIIDNWVPKKEIEKIMDDEIEENEKYNNESKRGR